MALSGDLPTENSLVSLIIAVRRNLRVSNASFDTQVNVANKLYMYYGVLGQSNGTQLQ